MSPVQRWYERASKADPLYYYIAISSRYIREKELEKAIDVIEKALDLAPTDFRALYNLACYYSLKKMKNKAISTLEKTIQARPDTKKDAEKDKDFDYLRQFPKFRRLVGNQKIKAKS